MNPISPLNPSQLLGQRKPRLLVVDDEPDNLDLLYRTFRRDYQVLRADSGKKALEVLANDGEVAVIISDQRMPEMTGTEFLSKTVPEFPDTVRIILTGFTDVEDLVQAINNGQVYRYITKPWEPGTLKHLVQQAAHTYELLKQSNHALSVAQHQARLMQRVTQLGRSAVEGGLRNKLQFVVDGWGKILTAQLCAVLCVEGEGTVAYGDLGGQNLGDNALVQQAIATRTIQVLPDIADTDDPLYEATATRSHLVAPIIFQERLLAVVSFHWNRGYRTLDDVRDILATPADQMAQAMISFGF